LSCSIVYVNEVLLEREFELRQLSDAKIQDIASSLEYSDNEKFILINGLVYKKNNEDLKFVVSDAMIAALMRTYHDNLGHTSCQNV